MPLALLICGDRNWEGLDLVTEDLKWAKPTIVIEGEARGADTEARVAAESLGITVEKFPAEWERYGKGAGPIRNQAMLSRLLEYRDLGWDVKVIAYHNNYEKSKGTRNMVEAAEKAKVDWKIVAKKHSSSGTYYGSR